MRLSVSIDIDAPPDRVWRLVSDVTQIGRFSPETFAGEWLGGATAPSVGVRFRGHVRRNQRWPVYWTTCRIVACEPDRTFAFAVEFPPGRATSTWRYDLEPAAGGGTRVTESFELGDNPALKLYWKLAGGARGRTNLNGMRTTLERVKSVAEAVPGAD